MIVTWTVRMRRADVAGAAALRLRADVIVRDAGDDVWVGGTELSEQAMAAVARLRGERFDVDGDGRLRAAGRRVPVGRLPDGDWVAARDYFRVKVQPAALPAQVEGRVGLRLVRSRHGGEAAAVLVTIDRWATWATAAPAVRLNGLRFAVSARGDVLVRGRPLPPVSGTWCTEVEGVLAPCGWDWEPAVDPATLRQALGLADGEIALFRSSGSWERLAEEHFAAASRSAARLSAAAAQQGEQGGRR